MKIFRSDQTSHLRDGSSHSNASPWSCKAAALSGHTKEVSTRPWQRRTSTPDWIAAAYRLEPLTLRSSRETRRRPGRSAARILAPGDFERALALARFWRPDTLSAQPIECQFRRRVWCNRLLLCATGRTPWLVPGGTLEATSFYDTRALKQTLERLVDFDRLNTGMTRFSAGAVNVRTGNFVYFDNSTHTIGPEHVMASGALPPGFPAIEIEGEQYWDGGLVSNTPLQWMAETAPRRDTLTFQVDLWSARGDFPHNMLDVMTREKEICFSSRTRAGTDQFKYARGFATLLPTCSKRYPRI